MPLSIEQQIQNSLLHDNGISESCYTELEGGIICPALAEPHRIFDAHLITDENNRLKMVPKPIGFVIGEQVIRPTIDCLSALGKKAHLMFSVTTDKINYLGSLLPNLIPIAKAEELAIDEVGNRDLCKKDVIERTEISATENEVSPIEISRKNTEAAQEHLSVGATLKTEKTYEDAEYSFLKAKEIYESLEESLSVNAGKAIKELGILYNHEGNHLKAFQLGKEALNIFTKKFGEAHIEVAHIYEFISNELEWLNEYDQAIEYLEKAQSIYSHKPQNYLGEIANNFYKIGHQYALAKNYSVAISIFQIALEKTENVYGEDSVQAANIIKEIGIAQAEVNKYEQGLISLKKAKKIFNKLAYSQSKEMASIIETIGLFYIKQNKLVEGVNSLYESLQILKNLNLNLTVDSARVHYHIANHLNQLDKFDEAYYNFLEAKNIYFNLKTPELTKVVDCARSIGIVLKDAENYVAAIKEYKEIQRIQSQINETPLIEMAEVSYAIGHMYIHNLGEHIEGAKHLKVALKFYEKNPEKYWLELAILHTDMALYHDYETQLENSIRHARIAANIYSEKKESNLIEFFETSRIVVSKLLFQDKKENALALLHEILPIAKEICSQSEIARLYEHLTYTTQQSSRQIMYEIYRWQTSGLQYYKGYSAPQIMHWLM